MIQPSRMVTRNSRRQIDRQSLTRVRNLSMVCTCQRLNTVLNRAPHYQSTRTLLTSTSQTNKPQLITLTSTSLTPTHHSHLNITNPNSSLSPQHHKPQLITLTSTSQTDKPQLITLTSASLTPTHHSHLNITNNT